MAATDHLQKALNAMVAERAELDANINVLTQMLGAKAPVASPRPDASVGPISTAPSVNAIVMDMVAGGAVVTLPEIVTRAKELGNTANYNSISSVVSRLRRRGMLAKGPTRGSSMLPVKNATEGDGGAEGPNLGSNSEVAP